MVCDMALVCRSARDLMRGIKVPEYIFSIIIPHQQLASVGVTILDLVEYFLHKYRSTLFSYSGRSTFTCLLGFI